jgi:two-component system CheB/CheR fusion protein
VTFLDVTERRKAEQEIQDGVRRREQFLAMLSHELRNPLAAILSAVRVLESAEWANDSCRSAGAVVARQATHMARLLDDLLDVARITRGRIVLRKTKVDLRETAQSAIEALGPFMAERQTRLTADIDESPIPVYGDPARLQQIQANLLSNASKYSPEGADVHFQVRRDGRHARILVSDRGRGIERDMLPYIFDLFVQGPQSVARTDGGMGIGLTLLRQLVQLHDGTVEAHSDGPERGSLFTVTLPLDIAEMSDTEHTTRTWPPAHSVVVVEDQADARLMMQLVLESQGLTVSTAENGKDGVELIEQLRPDLALVDLGLPVMNGFELARKIRKNGSTFSRTRLVALSGYGQDADVEAALAAGFDEHLTKPVDLDRLTQILQGGRSPSERT